MKTIAALMTVHNRKKITQLCLDGLLSCELPFGFELDIFITDDGCTDGTREMLEDKFPQVHIVDGTGYLFWSRGMYHAWLEAAKGDYDYYLWLNDDTNLYKYAVKDLIEESHEHLDKALIVGACESSDQTHMTYGGRDKNGLIFPNERDREITLTNGNVLLVPNAVFKILGNIDYHFHHGGGDFNYSWRAQRNGIKIHQPARFLAQCDWHEKLSTWCDPKEPLLKRWKALYRPNSVCPPIYFYEQRIMHGVPIAFFRWTLLHIRTLFPDLWMSMGKKG